MYMPIGIHNRVINKMIREMRDKGFIVERHSYSFRVMYNERFIASFHIYPGYKRIVFRILVDPVKYAEVLNNLMEIIEGYFMDYTLEKQFVNVEFT